MPFDDYLLTPMAAEQSENISTPCTFVVRYFSSFPVFHIHFMATCFVKRTNTVYNKFQPAIFKNGFLIFSFFFFEKFCICQANRDIITCASPLKLLCQKSPVSASYPSLTQQKEIRPLGLALY